MARRGAAAVVALLGAVLPLVAAPPAPPPPPPPPPQPPPQPQPQPQPQPNGMAPLSCNEDVCQNHNFNQAQCRAAGPEGCCHWDAYTEGSQWDGVCSSKSHHGLGGAFINMVYYFFLLPIAIVVGLSFPWWVLLCAWCTCIRSNQKQGKKPSQQVCRLPPLLTVLLALGCHSPRAPRYPGMDGVLWDLYYPVCVRLVGFAWVGHVDLGVFCHGDTVLHA